MKYFCSLVVLGAVVFFASGIGFSDEAAGAAKPKPKCVICENAMSGNYLNKAGGRLCRGIANAAFGWTDAFMPVVNDIQKKTPCKESCDNFAWGVLHAFTRTAGGIVDTVTFWEPQIHNDKMNSDCPFGRAGLVDR